MTSSPQLWPCYDITRSYEWNYDHAPTAESIEVKSIDGEWSFCGRPVASPLGIPAGPLLNGRWVLYYAGLGFDVLTYKTVRSSVRACFSWPNLLPVRTPSLHGGETNLPVHTAMEGSWAVSFGMPSTSPDVWRRDVELARQQLRSDQILVVSVVGSIQPGWSIDELADDYAQCAAWAMDSGADAVETNFSCPNVSTCDGQLYQQPGDAAVVASRVRGAIGPDAIYLAKIGHFTDESLAAELLNSIGEHVTGLAMTNSIAATVVGADGNMAFAGQPRGICGRASRDASVEQVRLFSKLIERSEMELSIVGVGGIESAADVSGYLDAGAKSVQIATAAMVDPSVALRIRENWLRK
jgi:dihydroorotate dehydrogenase (NAD+) catalytic subunit